MSRERRTPDHQRAVLDRRRSSASGTHMSRTPRSEVERKEIAEQLDGAVEDGTLDLLGVEDRQQHDEPLS